MIPADWLPAPGPQLAYAMAIVLLAGIVRGFAGFGFSALTWRGCRCSSPAQVVPAVFVLEVVASLTLLPSVWARFTGAGC
jgi:hypothetical protein